MANRLFLTLLALLTGLAAQIAPAQARACAQQTAAVALVSPMTTRAPAAPADLARLPAAGHRHVRMVADEKGASIAPAPLGAPVRIGIDRARE